MTNEFDSEGMEYTIEVAYPGAENLAQFQKDLAAASAAFAKFKTDLASIATEGTTLAEGLKPLVTATQKLTKATKDSNVQSSESEILAKREAAAHALVEKRLEKRAVFERAAAIEVEKSIVSEKKAVVVASIRERALKSLERLQDRLATSRDRLRVALAKELDLAALGLSALSAEERARRQLSDAIEKQKVKEARLALATAQGLTIDGKKISKLSEREQHEEKLLALMIKREAVEAFATFARDQGFDTTGKELENLSAREKANAKLDKIVAQRTAKEELLAAATARGLDITGKQLPKLSQREALENRLNAAIAKRQEREIFENFARNKGFDTSGKELENLKAREKAEKRLDELQAKRADADLFREVAEKRGLNIDGSRIVAENEETAALKRLEAAQAKLNAARTTLGDKGVRAITAETEALRRQIKAEQELAITSRLKTAGLDPTGKPTVPDLTPAEIAQKRFAKEIENLEVQTLQNKLRATSARYRELKSVQDEASESTGRVGFTYRRLIGIFAAFTVVRTVIQQFKELVRGSISYNATLESNASGVAALAIALGDVADAQGNVGSKQQQFGIALTEAKRQLKLLRAEGLLTNATVSELGETFQTALAPGITAGLKLNEIRSFTVKISQIATAIALPQNQLAEEIRSLLSGTIQARTTRIATALGITNENIRQAKELGTLAEFLQARFESFNVAALATQSNFNVLLGRAKQGLDQLIGEGALPFFLEVKAILQDITGELIKINAQGAIEINPQAKLVVREIASGLTKAVSEGRKLVSGLNFRDAMSAVKTISSILTATVQLSISIAKGIGQGLTDLSAIAGLIRAVVEPISSLFGSGFNDVLATIIRILLVSKAIAGAIGLIAGLTGTWKTILDAVGFRVLFVNLRLALTRAGMIDLANKTKLVQAALGPILIAITALSLGIQGLREDFETVHGVTVSWGNTFRLVLGRVILSTKILAIALATGVGTALLGVGIIATKSFQLLIRNIIRASRLALDLATALVPDSVANKLKARFETIAKAADDGIAVVGKVLVDKLVTLADRSRDAIAKAGKEFDKLQLEIAGASTKLPPTGADEEAVKIQTLSEAFDQIPAILNRSREGVERTTTSLKDLREELTASREELSATATNIGLDGTVLQQRRLLAEGETKARKETKEITADLIQAEKELLTIKRRQALLDQQIQRLPADDLARVTAGIESGRALLTLNTDLAESESKLTLLQLAKQAAVKRGDTTAQANLSNQISSQETLIDQIRNEIVARRQQADLILENLAPERQELLREIIIQRIGLIGQEKTAAEDVLDIDKERAGVQQLISQTVSNRIAELSFLEVKATRDQIKDLEVQIAAEERLARARRTLNTIDDNQAVLKNDLDTEKAKLVLLKEEAKVKQLALVSILKQTEGTVNQLAILSLLSSVRRIDLLTLTAQEQVLNRITQAIEAQARALQAASEQKTFDLTQSISLLQQQVNNEKLLAAARATPADAQDDSLAQAQAEFGEQSAKLAVLQEQTKITIKRLAIEAQFAPDLATQLQIYNEINLIQQQSNLQLEAQQQLIDEASRKLEEQRRMIEEPVSFGIERAFDNFVATAANKFQQTLDIVTNALNGVVQVGGQAFASIFDPDSNFKIREATGRLALEISKQIFETQLAKGIAAILPKAAETATETATETAKAAIILSTATSKAAIETTSAVTQAATLLPVGVALSTAAVTLISAAAPLGVSASILLAAAQALIVANSIGVGFGFSEGGSVGFSEGGPARKGPKPTREHARAPGYSRGGRRDPRDTIAAWLRVGEWVIRPEVVRTAPDFFPKLNAGLIDPFTLNALADGAGQPISVRAPRTSFAEGGPVHRRQRTSDRQSERRSEGPIPAYMVPDDSTLDSLLSHNNGRMFLKHVRINGSQINAILGRR